MARWLGLSALISGCLVLAGCGNSDVPRPVLSGRVTFKGSPLPGGNLCLYSPNSIKPVVPPTPGMAGMPGMPVPPVFVPSGMGGVPGMPGMAVPPVPAMSAMPGMPGTSAQFPPAHVIFIRPDGSFEGTGPAPGQYRVAIQNRHLEIRQQQLAPAYASMVVAQTQQTVGRYLPLPGKYTDPAQSGLNVNVVEGTNRQDIELR
jgi:hypothetical protein